MSDDAFILFRVVDNLTAGHGPVFNPGFRVEAYSDPLWMFLLAVWRQLGGGLSSGSVFLGLTFSVLGIVLAQLGCLLLWPVKNERASSVLWLPAGGLVFASIPVVWDFTTSGLETGMAFAWLGGSFLFLSLQLRRSPGPLERTGTALVIGLGPLVRPDLGVFFLAFLGLHLLFLTFDDAPASTLLLGGALGLLPAVGYEVFRMGYFAALVPNPALAKTAAPPHWAQGVRFLRDFTLTYHLWFPVLLIGVLLINRAGKSFEGSRRRRFVLLAALLAAVLVHGAYIVRIGGGFMHGRLLLPTLFVLLLPAAAVSFPPDRIARFQRGSLVDGGCAALIVGWALLCAFSFRVGYAGEVGPWGIADERGTYVNKADGAHPLDLEDYGYSPEARLEDKLRSLAGAFPSRDRPTPAFLVKTEFATRVGVSEASEYPTSALPVRADVFPASVEFVVFASNIGRRGIYLGPAVHLADVYGLADPIVARFHLERRGRPGHEQALNAPIWFLARFLSRSRLQNAHRSVRTAHRALQCPPLRRLLRAISRPLTPSRFLTNMTDAFRFHVLRIPRSPARAEKHLCRGT